MYSSSFLSRSFKEKFWGILAILTVSIVLIASVFWVVAHPYGTTWDEANYINQAHKDISYFQDGGLYGLAKAIIFEDRLRPPANRFLVIPITLLFGVTPTVLRLTSLFSLAVSLLFIYLAGKRLAGPSAGAFATIFLGICPIIIAAGIRFGTEYSLYLAISATLYFIFLNWNRNQEFSLSWLGLGLALGIGALAKTSFIPIAGPIIILAFILSWRKIIVGPSIKFLIKSVTFATILALPWWIINFRYALRYAKFSSSYSRQSLGTPSLETFIKGINVFVQSAIGPALTLLAMAILLTFLLKSISKQDIGMNLTQKTAIWVCLVGVLPLTISQLFTTINNIRLISPVLIPLALGIGLIAAATQWTRTRVLAVTACIIFCSQLFVSVTPQTMSSYQFKNLRSKDLLWDSPATVLARREQWDWSQLRQISKQYQIDNPLIAFLGNGPPYNEPQISYPWIRIHEPVRVEWLWRFESGKISWEKIASSVNASDIVVTAPEYIGGRANKDYLDNQYNVELIQKLQNHPRFLKPIQLKMGRFEPVQVFVFVRKPSDENR